MKLRSSLGRAAALSLGVLMGVTALVNVADAQRRRGQAPVAPKQTIVVFPLDLQSGVNGPVNVDYNAETLDALFARLSAVPGFSASRYNRRNVSLQRALSEDTIKVGQLDGPFNEEDGNARRSVLLAREMGYDFATSGTIAGYSFNESARTVSITLTVDVLNVIDGRVRTSAGVTGTATGTAEESEAELFRRALADAMTTLQDQLVGNLTGRPRPAGSTPTPPNPTTAVPPPTPGDNTPTTTPGDNTPPTTPDNTPPADPPSLPDLPADNGPN